MRVFVCVAASAVLLLSWGISPAKPVPERSTGSSAQSSAASPSAPPQAAPVAFSSKPLQEQSRLNILRSVDGEYAHAVTPLPGGKKGFHIKAGQPLDQTALRKAIQSTGSGISSGDSVQITRLQFLPRGILIDLNGGGHLPTHWKDHIHIDMGAPVMVGTNTTPINAVPVPAQKVGATLYLDFNRPLPDISSVQLKQLLATVLDFSKQRSAAVQYVETLPPKFQQAIAEKRAEVGMDRDEVMAALGRPDHKIRDRDTDGKETEDWIYGSPPAPIMFVQFEGDTVTQIHQYPHPLEDTAAESTTQR